jgi:hypothetical protein
VTPAGVPVHVHADVTEADPQTIRAWVDLRLEEWVANKAAWGCARFTDDELRFLAHSKHVIVYPGYYLPDHPGAMGWTSYAHPVIEVAINWPPMILNSDLYNGAGISVNAFDYSYGLRELPHEWTHTALGEWHP